MSATRRDAGVAQAAWTAVSSVERESFRKYRSRVLELPIMLRTSGLVASLAYLASKGEQHEALANQLASYLGPRLGKDTAASPSVIIRAVAAEGTVGQRRAEDTARMFADWLKRSVEARQVRGCRCEGYEGQQ